MLSGTVVIILSIWTGGDGSDAFIFENPIFNEQKSCVDYVKDNFIDLNQHVNKEYGDDLDNPNLFYCLDKDETLKKRLKGLSV